MVPELADFPPGCVVARLQRVLCARLYFSGVEYRLLDSRLKHKCFLETRTPECDGLFNRGIRGRKATFTGQRIPQSGP